MSDFQDTIFNERRVSLPMIKQQAENMRRFREHEAIFRSGFRFTLALLAVYLLGIALGQL